MTNEELAKALGVESGKLYFHTKQLLNAGLIERAGTREKGPITEKLYRAAAKNYFAPTPVLGGDTPPFADMVSSGLALYHSAWEEDREASLVWHLGYRVLVSIPRESVKEIAAEFAAILDRLKTENSAEAGTDAIAVTLLMHGLPRALFGDTPTEEKK
jgi:AcrR family transcriptional regulator